VVFLSSYNENNYTLKVLASPVKSTNGLKELFFHEALRCGVYYLVVKSKNPHIFLLIRRYRNFYPSIVSEIDEIFYCPTIIHYY